MKYTFVHVIAAAPGYFVLDPFRDENDKWRWDRYPVIAWGVSRDSYMNSVLATVPITIRGPEGDLALLAPDGAVYDPNSDEPFGSESFYRLHLNSGKK